MVESFLSSLLMLAAISPVLLLSGALRTAERRRLLAAALILFVVDGLLLVLPGELGLSIGSYNWLGKSLSILLLWTAVYRLSALSPARALLARPSPDWIGPTVACIGLMAGATAVINLHFGNRSDLSLETLAYQATVPGLSEELVFRAALLAGVNAATVHPRPHLRRNMLSPGVVVSTLLFGLAHGLWLDSALVPQVDLFSFAYTGAIGLGLAWITLRTLSIWPAIVSHNIVNLVGEAVRIANGQFLVQP
jgi:membrane protease YdiL (CAAX protease family)